MPLVKEESFRGTEGQKLSSGDVMTAQFVSLAGASSTIMLVQAP